MSLVENIAPRDLANHYKAVKARLNKGRPVKRIPITALQTAVEIPIVRIEPPVVIEPEIPDPHMSEPPAPKYPSIALIVEHVAKYFGVSVLDISAQRRHARVMVPRHVVFYLAKTMTLKSLPKIGRAIGGRDHTTILSGVRKMERMLPNDPKLAADVDYIRNSVRQAVEAAHEA